MRSKDMKVSDMNKADKNAYKAHKASRKMTNKNKELNKEIKVWQLNLVEIDEDKLDNPASREFYNATYAIIVSMKFSRRNAVTYRELINWLAETYSLYLARNAVSDIMDQLTEEVGGDLRDSEMTITDLIKDGVEMDSEWNTRIYKWGAELNGSLISLWLGGVLGGKLSATAFNKILDKFTNHTELIMKNESARVYAINQWRKFDKDGVKRVKWIAQTDACKICMPRDGHEYTLREVDGLIPVHPYCRCIIVPIKED
ncbi:head morphogenesis [Weissella phage PWc]|nr:head morphogenesis [Weissella phage PWc]